MESESLSQLLERMRVEQESVWREGLLSLREQVAALESREVCAAAHDNVETCGYCQRDALKAENERLTEALRKVRDSGNWVNPLGAALIRIAIEAIGPYKS